ncbi:Proteasome subunit alpha type-2-A [Zancudomyces culisetae]|uniref:Proteasome subunit alpha type-2-A n=1 Tax=Zancudomyces culisetae TaxID=1213189 RepID=A0A1R1PLV9_ZANCU|nr:Proteasome subunit alpha type-2-A [Zancudomyces culisetae]|eukprot:OMH81919.1 Proteasome subunit alpha type-2-A [Zancudomyces culisetae]
MQEFTQSGGVRPFGVSLLIAGIDEDDHGNARPCLYQLDPSGAYFPWKATAIGKNMASLKSFLEKRYGTNTEDLMILEDTIHTAILALKEGFEGQLDENSIEIGIIGADTVTKMVTPTGEVKTTKPQFKKLGKSEIRDYLANI